ncbi:inositol-polyphosphate 5-phosphatase, putative [Plasmodium gallinaceum]|uniref:Inositol-polyphosphate 5-phosphatase, putative n=1 Tax=Plasmodium gallinaceum TaxID=5849 RepID=A0A1J1GN86_PLAGA|nr:inositol-polyphosphate 5-phosphatase, putative [Plasmodium gallinaceum]CRG93898.1 inositol-polyphosphate 5-phosphatase, putative [Plasmodium gallinaceum]
MANLSLHTLKKYYLEPQTKYLSIVNIENNVKNILKINYTKDINIIKEKEYLNDNYEIENDNKNKFWFFGCLGIIKAEDTNFLVIVSDAEVVCYLFNCAIYRIKKFCFVQLNDDKMSKNFNENYQYEFYCLGTNGNLIKVNNNTKGEKKFFCNKKIQKQNYLDNIFESKNIFFERYIFKYNKFNYHDAYIHKFKNSTLKKDTLKTIIYFLHAFNKGPFYFSYYYNLSISLQKQYLNAFKKIEINKEYSHINNCEQDCNISHKNSSNCFNDFKKLQFSQINKEYTWNWKLLDKFNEIDASDFILFLIHGYIGSEVLHINNNKIILYLISRKNKNRSGVRFWCRGGNEKGDVANFVETEQIVICNDSRKINVFSYLLIRGSIPVLWKQQPTLRFRPRINIYSDMSENINILKLHMEKLKKTYGKISITNLINKKFGERYLGECFEMCLKKCNVEHNFTWFDFHSEFKKLNFEALQKSLKTVVTDLNDFSYFSFSFPNTLNSLNHEENFSWLNVKTHSFQKGIFRVNCIDCLDRTNVFQSFLAKYILFLQLKSIHIKLEQSNNFPYYFFKNSCDEILYRKIWINNANAISIIYSGAGALKNDITQNGKRTVGGLFQDLYYILLRYINNNFLDGYNNDCINLATNENLKYSHIFNIHKGNYNQLIKVLLEFIIIFSASICTSPMQELLKRVYFFTHNFIINSFSNFTNYIFFLIRKNFHLFLFPLNQTKYFNFISILAKTSGVVSISFLIFLFFCIYVFFQKKRVMSSPQLDTNT